MEFKWEIEDTQESLQYLTSEVGEQGYPLCPHCGKETHYHYAQVDMTPQGDAINAEWYSCHPCGIGTPLDYED